MARGAPAPFNNPFADKRTVRRLRALAAAPVRAAPSAPRKPVSEGPRASPSRVPTDDALWWAAVEGGKPLEGRGHAPGPEGGARLPGFVHPDDEAAAALARFMAGEGALDVHDTDEAVESPPGTADPALLQALRRGAYSVQRHVDLHGLRVDEARVVLAEFFTRAQREHVRCVLVVHGRGLHSKDRNPVLKERVVAWLTRGRLSRGVLAFATARPHDGGAGALYVLLRSGAR